MAPSDPESMEEDEQELGPMEVKEAATDPSGLGQLASTEEWGQDNRERGGREGSQWR